jgi:hypothetical protein
VLTWVNRDVARGPYQPGVRGLNEAACGDATRLLDSHRQAGFQVGRRILYSVENRSLLRRAGQSPVESTDDSPEGEIVGTDSGRKDWQVSGASWSTGALGVGVGCQASQVCRC